MKIQCDVCNKDEAAVFCLADEAALCAACDHRVHHANTLAGKHPRFSLLLPSPKHFPLCDICQEKRAFLFCQQDRAILCKDCDVPIHKANEHTRKHNRFLLTGVKLSATSTVYSQGSSSVASRDTNPCVPNFNSQSSITKPFSVQPVVATPQNAAKAATAPAPITTTTDEDIGNVPQTSSISEYLMEMLPGWQVEDFLDSSSAPFGFSKSVEDVLPIWDSGLDSGVGSFSSSQENIGIWVPQTSAPPYPPQHPAPIVAFGNQVGLKPSKEALQNKAGRNWMDIDGCFTVPQISPPSTVPKRPRISR
ncbi:hypothetical protein NMG60_11016184 [Bertholletia excelsa]